MSNFLTFIRLLNIQSYFRYAVDESTSMYRVLNFNYWPKSTNKKTTYLRQNWWTLEYWFVVRVAVFGTSLRVKTHESTWLRIEYHQCSTYTRLYT